MSESPASHDAASFFAAVKSGNQELVRACLEADPALASATDEGSFDAPAVILAAGRKDRGMIDLLLSFGADLDQKSRWWAGGFTALNSGHPRDLHRDGLADFLIDRGATVDAHSAAGLGRLDRLRELVAADPAVVHEPGGDGLRPLHYAANPEIAAFLLDHGAEIDARDVDHHGTAAQWNVLARPEVSRFLVERGAAADLFLHTSPSVTPRRCADLWGATRRPWRPCPSTAPPPADTSTSTRWPAAPAPRRSWSPPAGGSRRWWTCC